MRFVWTIHALERMKQRRISRTETEDCIKKYMAKMRDKHGNLMFICRENGYAIVIIAKDCGGDCLKIITAYRTSKLKKYTGQQPLFKPPALSSLDAGENTKRLSDSVKGRRRG